MKRTVFWEVHPGICMYFLNAEYYSNWLENKLRETVRDMANILKRSFCFTIAHGHIRQILQLQHYHQWAGKPCPIPLIAQIYRQVMLTCSGSSNIILAHANSQVNISCSSMSAESGCTCRDTCISNNGEFSKKH